MNDGVISSTAEINTGKSMVEVKGGLVRNLPVMSDSEKDFAISQISKYILNHDETDHMMLMRREDNYITIFRNYSELAIDYFAREIFNFINTEELFISQGGVKLIESEGDHIEVWIGDKFYILFDGNVFFVDL